MKKTITALLLAGLLVSALGCGDSNDTPDTKDTKENASEEIATETVDPNDRSQVKDNLPETDLQGQTYNMLIRTEWSYEFNADEDGDVINDAIVKRNRAVEERFNVDLVFTEESGTWDTQGTFLSAVTNAVLAGDACEFDAIAGYQAYMVTPAVEGYLLNIYDVPHIDTAAVWWSPRCNGSMTVNGKMFLTTGDIALSLWEGLYVYYYNKKVASDYDMPDFYSMVRDGTWTVEKVRQLSTQITADVNGDAIYDENDLYGFIATKDPQLRNYVVSCDTPITMLNEEGIMELTLECDRTQEALTLLCDLHHTQSSYLCADGVVEQTIFQNDRTLFMSGTLDFIPALRAMETDFGILPYPKLYETDNVYKTSSSNGLSMICFPMTVRDAEFSGLVTEALCAESYRTVIPAYYDVSLKAKGIRDEDSGEMLDLIRDGLTFDFGWVHSAQMSYVGFVYGTVIQNKKNNFSSWWAANKRAIQRGLDKVNEAYSKED